MKTNKRTLLIATIVTTVGVVTTFSAQALTSPLSAQANFSIGASVALPAATVPGAKVTVGAVVAGREIVPLTTVVVPAHTLAATAMSFSIQGSASAVVPVVLPAACPSGAGVVLTASAGTFNLTQFSATVGSTSESADPQALPVDATTVTLCAELTS